MGDVVGEQTGRSTGSLLDLDLQLHIELSSKQKQRATSLNIEREEGSFRLLQSLRVELTNI